MGRILSIDFGKKRTGIAVTDPLQIIANGLVTVATSELLDFLKTYVAQENVERIVIGRPLQLNGRPSENLARVGQFVSTWRKTMPTIPIEYYDERFTSKIASHILVESGTKKKKRQDKALLDKISATLILQDYLSSLS